MFPKERTTGRWTKDEDRLLQGAIADYEEGEDINWHDIASHIPGRDNKACRKRWVYALAPEINKGAWDEKEDTLLMKGIQVHGFRWALVSQVVGSRQPDQCSRRWHEALNPKIDNSRWSLLEDQTLREAVKIYGRRWTEIVERYFPNRTPIAAKNRYTQRFEKGKSAKDASTAKTKKPRDKLDNKSSTPETLLDYQSDDGGEGSGPELLWNAQFCENGQSAPRAPQFIAPSLTRASTYPAAQPQNAAINTYPRSNSIATPQLQHTYPEEIWSYTPSSPVARSLDISTASSIQVWPQFNTQTPYYPANTPQTYTLAHHPHMTSGSLLSPYTHTATSQSIDSMHTVRIPNDQEYLDSEYMG